MRIVSPSQEHYAVLKAKLSFGAGPFSLHRRREGVEPMKPATAADPIFAADARKEAAKIAPDPADGELCSGKLPRLPMEAKVCDSPVGIVLFDTYANLGYGNTLSFIDAKGREGWAVTLRQLFGGVPKGTTTSTSSLWWSEAWGLDVERRTIWVLSRGREFREVKLDDGTISVPAARVLARWCLEGPADVRASVLDAITSKKKDLDRAYAKLLSPIVANVKEPMGLRLRAAVACRRAGSKTERRSLFLEAAKGEDKAVALYAVCHLSEFAPEQAGPLMEAFLRRFEGEIDPRHFVREFMGRDDAGRIAAGIRSLGEPGLEILDRLVADAKASGRARLNAAALLSILGRRNVGPGLLQLCRDPEHGNGAINLLIWRKPAKLDDRLCDLLEVGSGDDGRIAMYFAENPRKAAAPLLRAALERLPASKKPADPESLADEMRAWARGQLAKAIAACKKADH